MRTRLILPPLQDVSHRAMSVLVDPTTAIAVTAAAAAPVTGLTAWLMSMHAWFALYHRHKGITPPRLSSTAHVRYYIDEVWACLTVASFYVRDLPFYGVWRPAEVKAAPVLCVHGFTQNRTNWALLRGRLLAEGRPSLAISLGLPFQGLDAYVPAVRKGLEALIAEYPDHPVDLVAHSMGGVVLRLTLEAHPDLAAHVGHVVTLGSPHRGTAASRLFGITRDATALRRRSAILAALPDFQTLVPQARVTTIAAERDLIVYPTSTSHLDGCQQIDLPGVGHVGLITHPRALAVVTAALRD